MSQGAWWLFALLIILIAGFLAFAIYKVVESFRRQSSTGREELIGKTAVVVSTLDPEGTVSYLGEIWNAISISGRIDSGEEVTISRVDGLILTVTKNVKE